MLGIKYVCAMWGGHSEETNLKGQNLPLRAAVPYQNVGNYLQAEINPLDFLKTLYLSQFHFQYRKENM